MLCCEYSFRILLCCPGTTAFTNTRFLLIFIMIFGKFKCYRLLMSLNSKDFWGITFIQTLGDSKAQEVCTMDVRNVPDQKVSSVPSNE